MGGFIETCIDFGKILNNFGCTNPSEQIIEPKITIITFIVSIITFSAIIIIHHA